MALFSSADPRLDPLALRVDRLADQIAALSKQLDTLGGLNTLNGTESARIAALEAQVQRLTQMVR